MQTSIAFPQALTDKYQPRKIADFVGLEKPKKIMANLAANPKPVNLLFFGKSGTGKTSLAFAFANEIDAEVHHITSQQCNVAAIDEVCRLCSRAPYRFFGPDAGPAKWHVVVIDEGDHMSEAAQLRCLSILDGTARPPQTLFVITCNETERFEPRFISRTLQIEFSNYGLNGAAQAFLERIWVSEAGPDAPKPNFAQIMRDCRNNLRDSVNALETELLAL